MSGTERHRGLAESTAKTMFRRLSPAYCVCPVEITLMRTVLNKFIEDEQGQDIIEYLLLASLVAFAAVFGINTLAGDLNVAFSRIGSKMNASMTTNTT
jgi:Flp pilus assembly pilin Flp